MIQRFLCGRILGRCGRFGLRPAVLLLHWALMTVLLAGLAAPYAPALAQGQAPITLEVRAGFDGAYRIAEWFPIQVSLANDGPDLRAVLEWRFPGQFNESVFQRIVDLPRGSRKLVLMSAFSRNFAQNGRLRLLDGTTVLAEQTVRLEAVDPSRFLIGVTSSDPALLNSLNSLQVNGASGATVRHLDPDALPDQVAALRALDALFLHDIDTPQLRPSQRESISQWTRLGGVLVVSGGLNGARTAAGFADLLPVEVTGNVVQGSLGALTGLAQSSAPSPGEAALSQVTPRTDAEGLPAQEPLIYRWPQGSGEVLFTAFDFAALRGWPGELNTWRGVIRLGDLFAPATIARQQRANLLTNVLRLPSLSLPSASMLLTLMLAYILVVGPLNYLVLRRLRRAELAWVTVPLTVVLFTSAFYFVGFGLRGSGTQVNQIAVVQGVEGQPHGFATAFIGLFSPRRDSFTLTLPAETLVSEARSLTDDAGDVSSAVYSDVDVQLPDVLVDIASVRTFMAESVVDVPLQVQSSVRIDGRSLAGEIRNTGGETLQDVMIVRGDSFWPIGSLAPGASGQIVPGSERSFPFGTDLSQVGNYNRQQMLGTLFDPGNSARFRRTGTSGRNSDGQGVYLIAWRTDPPLSVQVNGRNTPQDALTLYFIRLNS